MSKEDNSTNTDAIPVEIQDAIPVEIQEDTQQTPAGFGSPLWLLKDRLMKPFQCYQALKINGNSGWDIGISHSQSTREEAKESGISHSYVQKAWTSLCNLGVFKRLSSAWKTSKFEITHHLCDSDKIPLDKDGRPLKCAVPRGNGGPFERVQAGDITWKGALIWILLKVVRSNWATGETEPTTREWIVQWTGFSKKTVCDNIKQLVWAGMLTEAPRRHHEGTVFQLYPKPYLKRRERAPKEFRTWRSMRAEGHWRYSFSEQYRVNVATTDIQFRSDKNKPFRNISDKRRAEMPKSMQEHFDMAIKFWTQQEITSGIPLAFT